MVTKGAKKLVAWFIDCIGLACFLGEEAQLASVRSLMLLFVTTCSYNRHTMPNANSSDIHFCHRQEKAREREEG